MRRFLKVLGGVALVFLTGIAAMAGVLVMRRPAMRPAPAEKIAATPERLARGSYLVEHVVDCNGCHSDRDWTRYGGPIKDGARGKGGYPFDGKLGVPGLVC